MEYTVTWHPDAERELTEIWLASSNRESVAQSANDIDRVLSSAPLDQGDEFYGDRILVVLPLAVTYTVREQDRPVQIIQVWCSTN
jgi:hypothetical protein